MTDATRELIQRMARELDQYRQMARDDCTSTHPFADEARALLAQPEPKGPTDEELHHLWLELYAFQDGPTSGDVAEIARAVLARWGRPAIEPVPVSERQILKSSNFNDANGHCWCGTRTSIDITGDLPVEMPSSWELRELCDQDDCALPHYALPIPTFTETP